MFDHGKHGPSPLSPSPPALTTKWTTPPEWTFLAIKMCPFQPHIWLKNHSTILLARGVTMKMAVCYCVANHHIAPGKKQWSWGHSEFGQAWDKSLTDNNGPYIELMTGIFADNQPDFTWLDAYEEKRFEQYFLPYHSLGMVQNASRDAVIKLQRSERGIEWGLYAISPLNGYRLAIREIGKCNALLDDAVALMPATAIQGVLHGINPERLTIELSDADGNIVLSYQEHQPQELPLPDVAKAPLSAQDITSTDEAWFIGQHLEQYHHASRSPFDYYLRGVALDPLDYRCNLALAMLEYNRADFRKRWRMPLRL